MGTPGNPSLNREIEIFQQNYFLWALQEAEQESLNDFPRLRSIPSMLAKTFLDFHSTLSQDERISLMRAQVKTIHSVSARMGFYCTNEENILMRRQSNYVRNQIQTSKGWFSGFPLKVPKKDFRLALRTALDNSAIGEYENWDGSNSWRYVFRYGIYTIYSYVDIRGPNRQLWYYHSIAVEAETLYEWISFTTWLGMGPTYFDLVAAAEIVDAAQSVKNLCQHFLSIVGNLLP